MPVARAVWLTLGVGLLVSLILVARRGDERNAFALAIAAALALSPIVWLHYFSLLLVVVAIAQPGSVCLVRPARDVGRESGHGNPTAFQETATFLAATLTVAVSLAAINGTTLRKFAAKRLARAVTEELQPARL